MEGAWTCTFCWFCFFREERTIQQSNRFPQQLLRRRPFPIFVFFASNAYLTFGTLWERPFNSNRKFSKLLNTSFPWNGIKTVAGLATTPGTCCAPDQCVIPSFWKKKNEPEITKTSNGYMVLKAFSKKIVGCTTKNHFTLNHYGNIANNCGWIITVRANFSDQL